MRVFGQLLYFIEFEAAGGDGAAITMQKRVTIRDVADRVQVHYSTVARALNNNTRVSEKTRLKVKAAAIEMGYAPDPMVSALSSYRSAIRRAVYHGTLAWLSNEARPLITPDALLSIRNYSEGAREQAAMMGYQIEEFPFLEEGMTPRRYVQVLRSRGITGIIVGPQAPNHFDAEIRMDWAPFSAVALGPSLHWPPIHRVSSNQFRSMKLVVQELAALGYRRIGLYVEKQMHQRLDLTWMGGYMAEMAELGLPIPELLTDKIKDVREVEDWVARNRLDAFISSAGFYEFWLPKSKLRVPQDIGFASLHVLGGEAQAGINQHDREIGRAAVNLLVGMMQRQEKGIPKLAQRLLIDGTWQQGTTVRRRVVR